MDLDNIFNNLENDTEVRLFTNSKFAGIEIRYSHKGFGFGVVTISTNLEDGTWYLDDDCTSKERVTKILQDAIPLILEKLYDKGNINSDSQ